MSIHRVLILGGTTEARELAGVLAERSELEVGLSLAGRTAAPVRQPVPVRSGGFGGAEGLAAYLTSEGIDLLIDATHPYAAHISANAAAASDRAGVPIIALRRPAWQAGHGDRWHQVDDARQAVDILGAARKHVFLALGRQELLPFEAAPQHAYVIRSVDPIEPGLSLPDATYILARGPFSEAAETELLKKNAIEAIVCKNSGGAATYGKIAAASRLNIPVIMFRRPDLPDVPSGASVAEVAGLAGHWLDSAARRKRGV